MSTPADWSAEEFASRLRKRSQARSSEAGLSHERHDLRRAAALLTNFDPVELRLPDGTAAGGAAFQLVHDCTARAGRTPTTWALRPDVRDAALTSFDGPDDARRTLEANIGSAPDGGPERMALAYLRGDPVRLADVDAETLNHVRQAVTWLALVKGVADLPAPDEIQRLLDRRRLVDPLHSLIRHGFAGREAELDVLRRHVGVLPARTWRGKFAGAGRVVAEWFGESPVRLPLVITGTGGIGKSTLIARFLLDHVDDRQRRFPFAYVDFERATLRIQEPVSLIAEMARQLAMQYPDQAAAFAKLAWETRLQARAQREQQDELDDLTDVATTRAVLGRDAEYRYYTTARDDDAHAARTLGGILARAVRGERPDGTVSDGSTTEKLPFLVALDSFEEAQYRASPILGRMWAMFSALLDAYPFTRVVVAGRAPVGHPAVAAEDVPTLALEDLDPTAAENVLRSRGVSKPVARALVARIGGNPLSLQLASDVANRMQDAGDTGDWVTTVPAKRRRLFGAVDDMLIQGVLYDRLLNHITNPDVRRLAHPGLVLRRITPDIIQHVLAPVCDVDVTGDGRAQELFDEMARELDLVELAAPNVLRHRADVRRVMLRLLAEDRAMATTTVERAAVAYFKESAAPRDRAEELYHRLRLGGNLRVVESRWKPEVAGLLAGAADELPARSARLLSRLLRDTNATLGDEDQLDWEQRTAEEAENLLAQGYVTRVLKLLEAGRPWTTGSPLHALRVEALLRKGRLTEARQAVADALAELGAEQHGDAYLELLLLSAQVAVQTGDVESAESDFAMAEHTATALNRELDALGAMLQRARLHAAAIGDDDIEAGLARRVEAVPEGMLAGHAALFRAVAAEVGEREPGVLARALDLVGLPPHSKPTLATLARTITDAVAQQPAVADVIGRVARSTPERWRAPRLGEVEDMLQDADQKGELDQLARELLTIRDDSGSLRAGIAAAMSAEISQVDEKGDRT